MIDEQERLRQEARHGRWLAEQGAEAIWGWASPAGRLRAERRAHWLTRAAGLGPGVRALEIGCGTGLFTKWFGASGAEITAIDLSPDLLALAQSREGIGENVRFVHSSLEAYSAERRFDAVVGSSVLHHLDLEGALSHILHLLDEDGRVAFAEPNGLNPQIVLQKRIPWLKRAAGDVATETSFTRWSITRQMREAGYRGVRVTPRDWLHPATPSLMIGPFNSLQSVLERIPGLKELAGSLYIRALR